MIKNSVRDFEDRLSRGHERFLLNISKQEEDILVCDFGFTKGMRVYINRVDIEKIMVAIRRELTDWLFKIEPEKVQLLNQNHSQKHQEIHPTTVNVTTGVDCLVNTQVSQNSTQQANDNSSHIKRQKSLFIKNFLMGLLKAILFFRNFFGIKAS